MATGETIFLLERRTLSDGSLSFPKDPHAQNHGGPGVWTCSGDLIFRVAAMSALGFFFSKRPRFIELPQARERVSTATGRPARQTAVDLGVQRRETRPINCEQTHITVL